MASFMEQFNTALTALMDSIKAEIMRINKDTDEKIAQMAIIRVGLQDNAQAQKHLAKAMDEASEKFEDVSIDLIDSADRAQIVVDILNELSPTTNEPIGYCANCGMAIYSEGDYDKDKDRYFCSDECYYEYNIEDECEDTIIGYCRACGEAIFEDDTDYIDNWHGLFCCVGCENNFCEGEEIEEEGRG